MNTLKKTNLKINNISYTIIVSKNTLIRHISLRKQNEVIRK